MANWIQKNMGMITMIAAVLSALILALPMLGIQLPTREGKQGELVCIKGTKGTTSIVGFDENTCAQVRDQQVRLLEKWECSGQTKTKTVNAGVFKGETITGEDCWHDGQPNTYWIFKQEGPVEGEFACAYRTSWGGYDFYTSESQCNSFEATFSNCNDQTGYGTPYGETVMFGPGYTSCVDYNTGAAYMGGIVAQIDEPDTGITK